MGDSELNEKNGCCMMPKWSELRTKRVYYNGELYHDITTPILVQIATLVCAFGAVVWFIAACPFTHILALVVMTIILQCIVIYLLHEIATKGVDRIW